MALPNVFESEVTENLIQRIEKLDPEKLPLWGKMTPTQMLAHCSVTYEMIFSDQHPRPNGIARFFLKMFIKNAVVSEKPYKKNSPTAPAFLIKDQRQFSTEKKRLIDYLIKTQQAGPDFFKDKESNSFGKLNITEWNNMMYKHVDYHLGQFGV